MNKALKPSRIRVVAETTIASFAGALECHHLLARLDRGPDGVGSGPSQRQFRVDNRGGPAYHRRRRGVTARLDWGCAPRAAPAFPETTPWRCRGGRDARGPPGLPVPANISATTEAKVQWQQPSESTMEPFLDS